MGNIWHSPEIGRHLKPEEQFNDYVCTYSTAEVKLHSTIEYLRIESIPFMQQPGLLQLRSIACASQINCDGVCSRGPSQY